MPLPITATEADGSCAKGASASSFRITDDGRSQPVETVIAGESLPTRYALVVDLGDSSGTDRALFHRTADAAADFIWQSMHSPDDLATYVGFTAEFYLDQALTSDMKTFKSAVAKAQIVRARSAVADALMSTSAYVHKQSAGVNYRLVMILISAGDDNASRTKLHQAVETATFYNATVYALALPARTQFSENMRAIADATDGLYFKLDANPDYTGIFTSIRRRLLCGYELVYRPENFAPNSVHSVSVTAVDGSIKLTAPHGYRVPSDQGVKRKKR
ncbi:MAG: hypothetical protein ACR2IF_15970 [Terriglobales bacterium]